MGTPLVGLKIHVDVDSYYDIIYFQLLSVNKNISQLTNVSEIIFFTISNFCHIHLKLKHTFNVTLLREGVSTICPITSSGQAQVSTASAYSTENLSWKFLFK